ncbi:MAG: YaaA family protein [Bacilli bacterium]|nr:YaaA family protein [Bacilli bacterium]
MKIIIAPSKTMKYLKTTIKGKDILYKEENEYLHHILKQYNDEEIMSLMKISYKQATKVMDYLNNDKKHPALYSYTGTVFQQLELDKYQDSEYDYLDKHLNIMSAYYGVLNYNSMITPYRLDMTMKPNEINLYDYWYTPIYQYFKEEDYIISLASKEFTSMIKHPYLIFIDFIIVKNGKPTRNAMLIKKARGQMLNQMIINKTVDLDDLKKLSFDGFQYNEEQSHKNIFVYIKTVE